MCDLMIFHHDGDMMSALYSTPAAVIWDVCYRRLEKTNLKNQN